MSAEMPKMRAELHYGARVVRCFEDRPPSVAAMLAEAVEANPDGEAVVDGDTRLTYRAFDAIVARLAGGLAARGIGRGDRVALLLGNGIPFVAMIFAAARLGAISVPLSVREQMEGLTHELVDSGAALVVVDAEFAANVPGAEAVPDLKHRISVGTVAGYEPFEALTEAAPVDPVDVGEEETATILYTSGTTGRPKGAMLTGLGIVHSATNYKVVMGLGPADRTIIVVPMSHVTGLSAGIHSAVRSAATIVISRQFDALAFLDLAARERLTYTVLVPAMYNLCLLRANLADYDLSAWRIGAFGGAPMPEPTIARLAQSVPTLGLMNLYGATESTSPVTFLQPHLTREHRLSVGHAIHGAEIVIMGEDGREVPAGQDGEIWLKGPMVVPGYWRNPEATAREFVAGYWRSGDIGAVDRDGFVYVHDRKKDMINRGGYKIFTAQVESALLAVPGVREAAVIAKACPVLGERAHAVVSLEADTAVDEAALLAHCAASLADYQRPESYTIQADPLPRNANGKIMKRLIREQLGFASPA